MANTKYISPAAGSDLDSLICAIGNGNTDALAQLYYTVDTPVFAFALSILKHRQDAEDVLHDCIMSIHAAAPSYDSAGKPMAWILTIARNLSLKRLQDRSRTVQLNESDWCGPVDMNTDVTPDDKLVIDQCMRSLNDEERQIVILHAVAGFKHRQIADLLGMRLSTVLSKYHRAIKKLKSNL